jgi:hypothetical protein
LAGWCNNNSNKEIGRVFKNNIFVILILGYMYSLLDKFTYSMHITCWYLKYRSRPILKLGGHIRNNVKVENYQRYAYSTV